MRKVPHDQDGRYRFAAPPVQKIYLRRFCIALAVSIATTPLAFRLSGAGDALGNLYWFLGGEIFVSDGSPPTPFAVLLTCFPSFVFCYLFADFYREGLSHSVESVFTRTNKRILWLKYRLLHLFGFVFAYSLLGGIAAAVVAFLTGETNDIFTNSIPIVFCLLVVTISLNALMLFALLIPINLLTERFGAVGGFVPVMAVYLFSLLFCSATSPAIASLAVRILPTTQGVLAWHDTVFATLIPGAFPIEGFLLLSSYVYLPIIIAIEVAVMAFFIKRRELI